MPPRGLIERRDADQTMHAAFSSEHTVGVFAFNLHRGGFYAGFFAGGGIEDRGAETFLFRPAQVHAQKHFGPILRFRAARTGFHGDDGVELVGFAGHQNFGLELGEELIGGDEFLVGVFEERIALRVVGLFLRETDVGFDVADAALESFVSGQAVFDNLALLQSGLRLGLILPKIGVAGFCF